MQFWLYVDEHDAVVGDGFLCPSRWLDPGVVEAIPKLKRVPIRLIPAVGIKRRYQGRQEGAERSQRYSTKIMNYLVFEANKHTDRQPFVGLHVHPRNDKAIDLCRRLHFEDIARPKYPHPKAGVENAAMILKRSPADGAGMSGRRRPQAPDAGGGERGAGSRSLGFCHVFQYFFFFGNAPLGSLRRTSRRTRRAAATAFRVAVKEMSGPDSG
jgi:hypothetical protein